MFRSSPFTASLITMAALSLTSCAPHLNQAQCKSMNWYNVGFEDGSQGQVQRDLSGDITDCAKFKLKVNTRAYAKGWRAGTRRFCQPNNGFNLGAQGATYNPVCPNDLAAAFNQSYRKGLRRYCIPTTGYELGRAGKPLPSFCAADLNVAFSNAYQRGYRIYDQLVKLQNQLSDINNQLASTQDQIDQNNDIIQKSIEHHHARKRRIAQQNNDELQSQMDRLNDSKNSLQQQISDIQGNG